MLLLLAATTASADVFDRHVSFRVGQIYISEGSVRASPRLSVMLHVKQFWLELGVYSFPILTDLFVADPDFGPSIPSTSLGAGWMLAKGQRVSPMFGGELTSLFALSEPVGVAVRAVAGLDLMIDRHVGLNTRYLPGVVVGFGTGEDAGGASLTHTLRSELVFMW